MLHGRIVQTYPKNNVPFEDTDIGSQQAEVDIKNIPCNTVQELPVKLEEIKKIKRWMTISARRKKIKDRSITESKVYLICNDVLKCSIRVLVPLSQQKQILKELHTEHPGISRMKSLMRSYVHWRSMNRDIESLVKSCKGCALAAKTTPEKFSLWPETDRLRPRLYIDFAALLNGSYYLIVVDSFSKRPEILRCKKPTTGLVIGFLNELFVRFGVPYSIVSGNATQFYI